jgi:YVTN family beta-propeller protein
MNITIIRKSIQYLFTLLLGSQILIFTACENPENTTPQGRYGKGVVILNEGAFGNSNGEISFLDLDSNKITNNVFGRENRQPDGTARPLGDIIQSMTIHNQSGYIIANNSDKVLVVNPQSFKQTAEINLKQPRYMAVNGNVGYITEWVDNNFDNPIKGRVAIIDLQTNSTAAKDTITTDGFFPDRLVFFNNRLYVLNSLENTVAVLNTQTKTFEKKIVVGDSPSGIVLDKNNDLWIVFGGKVTYGLAPDYEETVVSNSSLVKFSINGSDLTERLRFSLDKPGAGRLISNAARTKLYYTFSGKVFEQDVNATTITGTPFLNRNFYGIGIDPEGTVFYGGVAPDFRSNGKMVRYNVATKAKIDSATVGIAPNGFLFK